MVFVFTGYRNSSVTFFVNVVEMLNGGALINARALSCFLY